MNWQTTNAKQAALNDAIMHRLGNALVQLSAGASRPPQGLSAAELKMRAAQSFLAGRGMQRTLLEMAARRLDAMTADPAQLAGTLDTLEAYLNAVREAQYEEKEIADESPTE